MAKPKISLDANTITLLIKIATWAGDLSLDLYRTLKSAGVTPEQWAEAKAANSKTLADYIAEARPGPEGPYEVVTSAPPVRTAFNPSDILWWNGKDGEFGRWMVLLDTNIGYPGWIRVSWDFPKGIPDGGGDAIGGAGT